MSDDIEDTGRCEAIADDLAELALDILSGPRRSEVLDHVETCPACRVQLDQLSIAAEAVLQLSPPMQPPLGFELRLAKRLQWVATPRPRRFRRAGLFAAAASLLVILAFGLGTLVAHRAGNDHTAAANLVTANFTSGTRVVGAVTISTGDPSLMLVTTEDAPLGTVTCEVTLSSGQVETVGRFTIAGEYAVWAVPLTETADQVRSTRLIDAQGATVASAQVGRLP
ncbi:MAG: zf-HC2 domain-containing protein [Actinomycetota bacterium]